jgi:F-type H+-transporting ATPase subunit b
MNILRPFVPFALAVGLCLGVSSLRAQEPAEQVQHEAQPGEASHGEAEGGHHAPIKLFGHELGKGAQFGIQVFNFAIFAGLLFLLLKGTLASAFKARAKELEEKLSQAERERSEADAQIKELETRMAGLQEELAGIMAKAETDAAGEKERILAAAKQEAAQILAQTQAEIDYQKRAAESELRSLVAELALQGATQRIQAQVTGETAQRILDRSIQQVGGAK